MCHCHTCEEECTVVEVISVTDRKTGQVKRKQRYAKEGSMVTAKFKVRAPAPPFLGNPERLAWTCSHQEGVGRGSVRLLEGESLNRHE